MKTTFLKAGALILALVMAMSMLVGCNTPNGTADTGTANTEDSTDTSVESTADASTDGATDTPAEDSTDAPTADSTDEPAEDSTDAPTVDSTDGATDGSTDAPADNPTDTPADTDPYQVKTTIYEISKHGNLILYMYGSALFEKGFEHGDIVEISVGDKKWDVPLCTSYSDVDSGSAVLRATSATDGVVLAINMGDFASTSGIAQKTSIDEDPGYRWDYLVQSPVELTITMKEEGGYREEWLIRQLVRTNERTDYPHLSDEAFANFRVINTTGMGMSLLYRSASPINPELGRNTYADKAAENAGIKTIINLADASNTYESTDDTYYSTCRVVYVNLGMDFLSEANLNGLATGMRYMIDNDGPYLIHCNEGKDRAGFVSALLEALMGASLDEIVADYMVTYYNYYGVEEETEKYQAVANNLIKALNTTFKVDDVSKADLAQEAEAYLMEDVGLTADEVSALKSRLTITLQEVYEASETFSSFLGDHENVYMTYAFNGKVYQKNLLAKDYNYTFYDHEYYGLETDTEYFGTESSEYFYANNFYSKYAVLARSGLVDMKARYEGNRGIRFTSPDIFDFTPSVTKKDGSIVVTMIADSENLASLGIEGLVAFEDTYILNENREVTLVNTVYTFEDGTVEEYTVSIERDIAPPEGAKPFLEFEEAGGDLRTVTIVSHPGTENEKTEYIQAPKGLLVMFSMDWDVQGTYEMYADAACTELISGSNPDADITVYVKWTEEVPEE